MKFVEQNKCGRMYQVTDTTPCFNTAKLTNRSLQNVNHYLVDWFCKQSAKTEFRFEPNNK